MTGEICTLFFQTFEFPRKYGESDCSEEAAIIEWIAHNAGYESQIRCTLAHCAAAVNFDGVWHLYHGKEEDGKHVSEYISPGNAWYSAFQDPLVKADELYLEGDYRWQGRWWKVTGWPPKEFPVSSDSTEPASNMIETQKQDKREIIIRIPDSIDGLVLRKYPALDSYAYKGTREHTRKLPDLDNKSLAVLEPGSSVTVSGIAYHNEFYWFRGEYQDSVGWFIAEPHMELWMMQDIPPYLIQHGRSGLSEQYSYEEIRDIVPWILILSPATRS